MFNETSIGAFKMFNEYVKKLNKTCVLRFGKQNFRDYRSFQGYN